MGAKVSSATSGVWADILTIAGSTWFGPMSGRRPPPQTTVPPSATTRSSAPCIASTASAEISGPMRVAGSRGSPMGTCR